MKYTCHMRASVTRREPKKKTRRVLAQSNPFLSFPFPSTRRASERASERARARARVFLIKYVPFCAAGVLARVWQVHSSSQIQPGGESRRVLGTAGGTKTSKTSPFGPIWSGKKQHSARFVERKQHNVQEKRKKELI